MNRVVLTAPAGILLALLATAPASSRGSLQRSLEPDAARAAFMRHHFALASEAHDALVRGDLDEARARARTLAEAPDPAGLPKAAATYVESMRRAAGRAASAHEAENVAAASAAMLAACGDCHRAVGTLPVAPAPPEPRVGGRVGHMLAHQAAANLMVQGLAVPSTRLWEQGARALLNAPLAHRDLPRDRALTREIAAEEERVHTLAKRAVDASDQRSRIYFYSELVQSCHACHALHRNVWGPGQE